MMFTSGCWAVRVHRRSGRGCGHHQRSSCTEALPHDLRPHPAKGTILGDFFEEVVLGVEDPRDAGADVVGTNSTGDAGVNVGDGVSEGEGHLLHGGRAGVADVVAADADRVEAGQFAGAVGHEVRREAQGGTRRVDVGAARDVLLEDVVLSGAGDAILWYALLLADDGVHSH
jgi:hypothetical protein